MLNAFKMLKRQANVFCVKDCLERSKHSNKGLKIQSVELIVSKSGFQHSHIQEYNTTKQIPLPSNIEDLESSEKFIFSPQRNRDINGSFISFSISASSKDCKNFSIDDRIECYDCSGAVSLSALMQSNVPNPFSSNGKPTHLNMPGGQWKQIEKYMSDDLNSIHHINNTNINFRSGGTCTTGIKKGYKNTCFCLLNKYFTFCFSSISSNYNAIYFKNFCTIKEKIDICNKNNDKKKVKNQVIRLNHKEKLKAAIKDYGTVIIVFHVFISLISLGCCYLVVASGIDLSTILKDWGAHEGAATAGIAAQFVIAYTVHKAMAPGRIAITLTAVPFIVKKLRKIGFLKTPKSTP